MINIVYEIEMFIDSKQVSFDKVPKLFKGIKHFQYACTIYNENKLCIMTTIEQEWYTFQPFTI